MEVEGVGGVVEEGEVMFANRRCRMIDISALNSASQQSIAEHPSPGNFVEFLPGTIGPGTVFVVPNCTNRARFVKEIHDVHVDRYHCLHGKLAQFFSCIAFEEL